MCCCISYSRRSTDGYPPMKNRAKSYWLVGLSVAVIVVLVAVYVSAYKPTDRRGEEYFNDPKTTVVFDESAFDVGKIIGDTIIDRTYRFRNTGKNPLLVYFVDSGCFCTGYSVSDKKIMPNETGEITLSLDTKEKDAGAFLVNAVVRMNTKDSYHSLVIEGDIVE